MRCMFEYLLWRDVWLLSHQPQDVSGYYLINLSDFCPTQNSPHMRCGIIEVTQWLDEVGEEKGMQKF